MIIMSGRGAAFFTLLRRAGTHESQLMDPGSAAHRKSAAQHPGNATEIGEVRQ
jgi:hypothetical protein